MLKGFNPELTRNYPNLTSKKELQRLLKLFSNFITSLNLKYRSSVQHGLHCSCYARNEASLSCYHQFFSSIFSNFSKRISICSFCKNGSKLFNHKSSSRIISTLDSINFFSSIYLKVFSIFLLK